MDPKLETKFNVDLVWSWPVVAMVAVALVAFVLLSGPTLALLGHLVDNTANYLRWLPALANPVGRTDTGFYQDWSIYYWAWWISWAPFVGLFLARISRGRTVREFMLGGLLAPSLLGILWLYFEFGTTDIPELARAGIDPFWQRLLADFD